MRKLGITPFIWLVLPFYLSGQFNFPTSGQNPEWKLNLISLGGSNDGTIFVRLGPDTLLCGEVWNPVDHFDEDNAFLTRIGYCRQTSDKVYIRQEADCNNPEFLLYDFGLEIGEVFTAGVYSDFQIFSVEMELVSVTDVWIGGQLETAYTYTYFLPGNPSNNSLFLIKGVGPVFNHHPFYGLICANCGEENYTFQCLRLGDNLVFSNELLNQSCPPTSDTIYVNQNVLGGNHNGTDWDNAFYDLQSGLSIADSGDVILVAEGIYFPDNEYDRDRSFVLPNGVQLFGGFAGNELSILDRDILNNPTVLSGDIGVPNDHSDNSYHVIYSYGVDASAVLDGFIVENGNANHPNFGDSRAWGGGYFIDSDPNKENADPRIRNCVFRDNSAYNGGAVYCEGRIGFPSLNELENSVFENNSAIYKGGGIYKAEGSIEFTSVVKGCEFIGNTANIGAGYFFAETSGDFQFEDCLFEENYAVTDGGGAYLFIYSKGVNTRFNNCNFLGNSGGSGGAISLFYGGQSSLDTSAYQFNNCHFENNESTIAGGGAISIVNQNNVSAVRILQSSFIENTSQVGGGGAIVFEFAQGSKTNVLIDQSLFRSNDALGITSFGAIYHHGHGNGSNPLANETMIRNSIFYQNDGVYASTNGTNGYSSAIFENCTFFDNGEFPFGKTWEEDFDYITEYNDMSFVNSILWEFTPAEKCFFNNDIENFTINDYYFNSCIINVSTCEVAGYDPCVENILLQVDPEFVDDAAGDLRLMACSPGINSANPSLLSLDNSFDFSGNPRILENAPDMGAHEQETFTFYSEVQDVSSWTSSDGEILIDSIMGGHAPYTLNWSTGDTVSHLLNLPPGTYLLTITDSNNCEKIVEFEVGVSNSTNEISPGKVLKLYPNPSSDFIYFDLPGSLKSKISEVRIINIAGQVVFDSDYCPDRIDVDQFASGLYEVYLLLDGVIYRGKVVIL